MAVGGINGKFRVRTPWELRSLEAAGEFGRELHIIEALLATIRPGDAVYDIGSNFGAYTILLARAVGPTGTVVAFEPEDQSYDHLQDNLKLNSLENVRSFRLALGDHQGQAKLFVGHTGSSSLVRPTQAGQADTAVKVIEGDRLAAEENLPLPRVVKIDVEGFEGAVIKGLEHTLVQPGCEMVCCEVHPQLMPEGQKPEDILDLLRSFGFHRIEIQDRGTTEFHALAYKT